MAGQPPTPLAKKLGLKDQSRVALVNAPPGFQEEFESLAAGAVITPSTRSGLDLILLFAVDQSELRESFSGLAVKLAPNGMLWVAWPKKSSGVPTDLSFNAVQEIGLAGGLVDTKVCAINETWSALRFVIRLKDRPSK